MATTPERSEITREQRRFMETRPPGDHRFTANDETQDVSPEEAKKLIQELKIHQAELQVQNEELQVAQERLNLAFNEYARLYNEAPIGFLTLDSAGIILRVNVAFQGMVGIDADQLRHRAFSDLIHAGDRNTFLARFNAFHAAPDGKRLALRLSVHDKPVQWVELKGRRLTPGSTDEPADMDQKPLLVSVNDITDRKLAELALARRQALVERIPAITYVAEVDAKRTFSYLSPQAESILGVSPADALSDPDFFIRSLHPEDRDRVLSELDRCRRTETPFRSEYRMIRRDGGMVWIQDHADIIRDEDGRAAALQGVMMDDTHRKRTEVTLRETEKRYQSLFNSSHDAIFVHSLGKPGAPGKFIEVNDQACRRLGYTREELLECTHLDLDVPARATPDVMKKLLKHRQVLFESVHRTKDGRHIPVEINAHLFQFNGEPTILSVARDITIRKQWEVDIQKTQEDLERRVAQRTADLTAANERLKAEIEERVRTEEEKKQLQAEALRAHQLAAVGELAAGVAHEINNPINGIINYAQILFDETEEADGDTEIPRRIIWESERIAKIVRNLLSFARERREERQPVQLKTVLADTLRLVTAQLKKEGIRVTLDLPEDLPPVLGNAQQIQQVFLNLISNAKYALNRKFTGPDPEKIIAVSCRIPDESEQAGTGPVVRTRFFDRGIGIPRIILDRICDPFFTTKPPPEGTGLGLSISHGIVRDHGGSLVFESVEGEYTRAVVDLPAVTPGPGALLETRHDR